VALKLVSTLAAAHTRFHFRLPKAKKKFYMNNFITI